jgi:hypothetical protein
LFSFWCNFKAKGDNILHFGVNKTIQGIIFIKQIFFFRNICFALNRTVVLRAKIVQIEKCQLLSPLTGASVVGNSDMKLAAPGMC